MGKFLAVLVIGGLVAAACASSGSGDASVVEYTWGGAQDLRDEVEIPTATSNACFSTDDEQAETGDLYDQQCLDDAFGDQFDEESPALRTQTIREQCGSSGADQIRLTWETFDGDKVTTVEDCP